MNNHLKFENMDEMIKEAEVTFRKAIGTLTTWSEQVEEVVRDKPGVLLAAVGVSGFLTGALVRHGLAARRSLPGDPLLLFLGGIVAGAVGGPKLIEETLSGLNRVTDASDNESIVNIGGARKRSSSGYGSTVANEKPFERS
jgi:hypothetical protein